MTRNLIPVFEIGAKHVHWLKGIEDGEETMVDTNRPLHLKQKITDAEGPVNLLGMSKVRLKALADRGLTEDGRKPQGYVVDKVEIDNHEVGVLRVTLVYQDALAQLATSMQWVTSGLIKPSAFRIDDRGMPFVGTLGRSELELAAAALVRACVVVHGDEWKPVTTADMKRTIELDALKFGFWQQPVCKPDWMGLVDNGWATAVDGEFPACGLLLTDAAAAKIIEQGWATT